MFQHHYEYRKKFIIYTQINYLKISHATYTWTTLPNTWTTLLHMHYICTGAYRHTRTKPCAVSFSLWCRTQGRCCMRHRVSVSAAAGTGLDSRALLQAAPRQCQCGSRNRLSGTGQAGRCSLWLRALRRGHYDTCTGTNSHTRTHHAL